MNGFFHSFGGKGEYLSKRDLSNQFTNMKPTLTWPWRCGRKR
jgi:hypothetical protein